MVDPLNFQVPENKSSFKNHFVEFIETLVVFAAIGTVIYLFIAQPHKVSGSSMFPNFHNNDYIITNKIGYHLSSPQRGQVIVFQNPRDTSQDFIKRIIGLPGDKVRVEGGKVYVGGQIINEPYLPQGVETNPGAFMHEGEDVEVPAGNYIVFGDNRTASSDSREWGFVTKDEIIGQALIRYWPLNSSGIITQATYSTK